MRRALREQRERDRKLILRHRWYAGGIATLLSAALLFSGMTPAVADETTPPPPATQATTEPSEQPSETPSEPSETEPSEQPSEPAETPSEPAETEPSETPSEPAEEPSAEPSPSETDVTTDDTSASRLAPAEDELVTPMALGAGNGPAPAAGPNEVVITVTKAGDRSSAQVISPLNGAVFGAFEATSLSSSAATAIETCTTVAGTCWMVVPTRGTGQGSTSSGYVVKEITAPANFRIIQTLAYSDNGLSVDGSTPYAFYTSQVGSGRTAAQRTFTFPSSDFPVQGTSGGGSFNARTTTGVWPNARINPGIPAQCGLNVALLVDLSSSVQQAGGQSQVRAAAAGVVQALTGTNSQVAIHTFSTNTPAPSNGNNIPTGPGVPAGQAVNANVGLQSVSSATSNSARFILAKAQNLTADNLGGTQYTNWDAGLFGLQPIASSLNAVIMLTDGMPTRYGSGNQSTAATRFIEMENAIASANAVKAARAAGVKIITVGVGAGASGDAALNLAAISGPNANSDYYQTSWENVANEMKRLASANCEGTVNVVKQVLPVGGAFPAAASTQAGWTFNATTPGATAVRLDIQGQSYTNNVSGQTAATGVLGLRSNFSGTTSADRRMSITENPGSQYTLRPWTVAEGGHSAGDNARCVTTAAPNTPLDISNIGNTGFQVDPQQNATVTCTVVNQAVDLSAQLRVDKIWSIDANGDGTPEQVTAPNVAQTLIPGLSAELNLGGNPGVPAVGEFGAVYGNLALNSTVGISETIENLPPLCTNVASYAPALVNGTKSLTIPSSQGINVVTITNTVTCATRLTLEKSVTAGGNPAAAPNQWTLDAIAPAQALPGPNGVTGANALVTANVPYPLAETPTTAAAQGYTQEWYPSSQAEWSIRQAAGATGSWFCVLATSVTGTGPGTPTWAGNQFDGRNGGVTVPIGQWAKCTAVNDPKPTLQLVKKTSLNGVETVVPVGTGNWTLSADWSALTSAQSGGSPDITPNPVTQSPDPITGVAGFAATKVAPGHFALTETGSTSGYTNGTSYSCVVNGAAPVTVAVGSSIQLNTGDAAVCTIVNTRQTGTLTITKTLDNPAGVLPGKVYEGGYSCNDSNPKSAGTWAITGTGLATLTPATGSLQIPTGTQCTVTESALGGGLANASWTWGTPTITQAGVIVAGQAVNATVANHVNRVYGSISITKALSGTPGGFTGTFTGTWSCTFAANPADNKNGTWSVTTQGSATLTGAYNQIPLGSSCSVAENTPSDSQFLPANPSYTWLSHVVSPATATPVNSSTVPVAFTVTNTAQHATIKLLKIVSSQNGGDPTLADEWELVATPSGGGDEHEFTTGDPAQDAAPGDYVISERNGPTGYSWTDLTCSGTPTQNIGVGAGQTQTVTVPEGGNVVCTLTNTAQLPTLTLVKIVDNSNGAGDAVPADWTLSATADGQTPVTGDGTASGEVLPGAEYTLEEQGGPSNYEAGDWSCYVTGSDPRVPFQMEGDDSVVPVVGTNVTCEITNTAIPATGSIVKSVKDGFPVQNEDGTWTIEYDVVVTNGSELSTLYYDLSDTLAFGASITPDLTTSTWTDPAGDEFAFDEITELFGQDIALPAAGEGQPLATHTYTVHINATVANGTQDVPSRTCESTEPNRAFLNTATITIDGVPTTVTGCGEPAFPEIEKDGQVATQNADSSFNVSYTIEVTNPSTDTDLWVALTDTLPATPSGWTLTSGWNVSSTDVTPDDPGPFAGGAADVAIWTDELPAGETFVFTVTGVLTPTASATPIGTCSPTSGFGLVNDATVTSGEVTDTDDGCVTIVLPPVTVSKTDATLVSQTSLTTWEILYSITVANTSTSAGTVYTLTDTPTPGAGWTADLANSSWVPVSTPGQPSVPTADTPIAASSSHTFQYKMVVTRNAGPGTPSTTCNPDNGGAFFNKVSVSFPGAPVPNPSDSGCGVPASPTVTKTGPATAMQDAGGDWVLSYTVTVTNPSTTTQLAYSLSDTPAPLPTGVDPLSWTITGPANLNGGSFTPNGTAWSSTQPQVGTGILKPSTIHVFTVTGVVQVTPAADGDDLACSEQPGGNGFWNGTTVANGVGTSSDDHCISIEPPALEIAKNDATALQLDVDTWQIDYTITVTNNEFLATTYTLTDTPALGDGWTWDSAASTWRDPANVNNAVPAPAANTPIAAAGDEPTVHTYVYRVIATRDDEPETPSIDCVPGQGGGFFNSASITFPGGEASDDGCAEPGSPNVDKVPNEATFDAATGLWTLSYDIVVTNTSGLQLAYEIDDTADALPAGIGGGAWTITGPAITGGTSADEGATIDGWSGTGAAAEGIITTGAVHSYTVEREVTIASDVPADDLQCGEVPNEGGGVWNNVEITNGVIDDDDDACITVERPTVSVEKTVTSTSQNEAGTWIIAYEVVVTNDSDELDAQYDLDDTLYFGEGIDVVTAGADRPAWSGQSSGQFAEGATSATLATGATLPAGGAHSYTVTVHATISAAAWESESSVFECAEQGSLEAGGFLNGTTVTAGGETDESDDCSEPAVPTIVKSAKSALQDPDDASKWTVKYDITVTSGGYATFYDLSDLPAFPVGVDVEEPGSVLLPDGTTSVEVYPGVDFVTNVPLAASGAGSVQVYEVTWVVDITEEYSEDDANCTGEPGHGFFNTATLTVGDYPQSDDDCIDIEDRVYPQHTKTVTSLTQDPATGLWTIEYEIEVTLDDNELNLGAEYDLTDTLDFGGDIEIESATWSGEGTTDEPFEADGTAEMAVDKTIAAGDTHTYTVSVEADVTEGAIDEDTTTCERDETGPYGGFLNSALLSSGGQEDQQWACAEPLFPEILKTGSTTTQNPNGTWDISYLIEVSYPSNELEVEPEEIGYVLTDAPELPGGVSLVGTWSAAAEGGSWPVSGPTFDGSGTWTIADAGVLTPDDDVQVFRISATVSVTAAPETPLECDDEHESGIVIPNTGTITSGSYIDSDEGCQVVHYDDIGLVKTSTLPGEQTSVQPGDVFDYVLTVTNYGTRPATNVHVTDSDLNDRLEIESLTVTPGGLSWTPPGYTGNDVDLTIASLPVDGVAVITVTVRFLPAAVNQGGDVVGPGDPVPTAPTPIDELTNTACVESSQDPTADPLPGEQANCDDEEIPVRDLTGVLYIACVSDAAKLGWSVAKSSLLVSEPIDMTWTPASPTAVPPVVALTEPGGTATWSDVIDWPGSAYTPSGVAIDYPGWRAIEQSDIVPGSSPAQYYLPGTTTVMTPEQQAQNVFNGLILDPTELDFAWRDPSTVTFSVNPTLTFTTDYPTATPEGCSVARHTDVQIEKTASVQKTDPGKSFTYTLEVENVSDDSAADGVVVTDAIPADIRISDVAWPGKGDATAFPNWSTCAVTGQGAGGYGGTLECVLFGPLQPVGTPAGGTNVAPTITLTAHVSPTTRASVITNVAVVDYHTFGDPSDTGRDQDDATVTLSALPATGSGTILPIAIIALVALLGGVGALIVVRRRRGESRPVL